MSNETTVSPSLARQLVSDELFDLTLYVELHKISGGNLKKVLSELIPIETRHHAFWQDFFKLKVEHLDLGQRVKLRILLAVCRVFKAPAAHLILEAIEIYGIRKYLSVWEAYRGSSLGGAVQEVLKDEFQHEDEVVSQIAERKINPERIRSIFLGLNDGLVELLGSVSGFFAAFNHASTILAASATVAIAGSLSMAAGAYLADSSEGEIQRLERGKESFVKGSSSSLQRRENPAFTSALVGFSYLCGAAIPILPVLIGARGIFYSIVCSAFMVSVVSLILAFLSGMEVRKRIALNLAIIAAAVAVTSLIGTLARRFLGISV